MYVVTRYIHSSLKWGAYTILLDTGCNAPVSSRKEFLINIQANNDHESSKTLGGSYTPPYMADSVAFGEIAYDPNLPFTILSYYLVASNGYVSQTGPFTFVAGFPTYRQRTSECSSKSSSAM